MESSENLPNFLVIGAAKAGTTSLHNHLGAHPEVFISAIKEPNYFAFNPDGPSRNYHGEVVRNEFPVRSLASYRELFAGAGGARAVGEVSPLYLASDIAAGRIRQTLPRAKLVAILRNPVDAAVSDYVMYLRQGRERRPPEEVFARPEACHHAVVYRYLPQLEAYLELFPPEQLLVILFEEFKADRRGELERICRFIGVDPAGLGDLAEVYNKGGVGTNRLVRLLMEDNPVARLSRKLAPERARRAVRKLVDRHFMRYPEVSEAVRDRLREYYRGDMPALAELLGQDLSGWGLG